MFTISRRDTVTQHPYRTAMVSAIFKIDRFTPESRAFEEKLAERSGKSMDNHVVYTLNHNGQELHFMCSDSYISVGTEIIEGSW